MIGKRIKALRKQKGLTLEGLAELIGTSKQTVCKYEKGVIATIPYDKIVAIATALDTTPAELLGWDFASFDNISPIRKKILPMVGDVACGPPIFVEGDQHETYVSAEDGIDADFCLRARGDSMTGARIYDGDIVFIRKQDTVDNGEIAAVIINDEATLKRVYYYPKEEKLILSPENPKYAPFVYIKDELNSIRIIGKAVAFQSNIF